MSGRKTFHTILCELGNDLIDEDIKKMRFLIIGEKNHKIPRQKLEDATTGVDLMEVAMEANLFSERDTRSLEGWLETVGKKNLSERLREHNAHNPSSLIGASNIGKDMLDSLFMETDKSRQLEQIMQTEDVVVISGCLGSGKTQMSIQFGYNFHKQYTESTVWIFYAKDTELLHNSMKKLAQHLGVLINKTQETENPCDSIRRLSETIARLLSEEKSGETQLMIFDGVHHNCETVVEDVIKIFVKSVNVPRSIKVIVTTLDKLFLSETEHLPLTGFSEDEAVNYLSGGKKNMPEIEKDALKNIAKCMSYLPLGLCSAKAYMKNCLKSGKAFLKFLNGRKIQQLEEKLVQQNVTENRSLFSALQVFIKVIEKDLDDDAYEMLQMTQFLNNDDIPVFLFEIIPSLSEFDMEEHGSEEDITSVDISLSTDSLVQAVQKFSFGRVHGIDDDRRLSTHDAVSLTLQAYTDDEVKRRLLKKLLWAFTLIMDKDNRDKHDYNCILSVLPHARSVLSHAEKILHEVPEDVEVCLLMTYVNDLVAYTYNFEGLLELEKIHSEKALEYCFKVMKTTEDLVDSKVGQDTIDETQNLPGHYTFAFAAEKAKVIERKLTEICKDHEKKEKVKLFTKRFIQRKRRPAADVKHLKEQLSTYNEKQLTMAEYKILCQRKKAVPFQELLDLFIKEIILSTLYTYGRRVYYIGKYATIDVKRKFCHYLFVASALGQIMQRNHPNSLPLYTMLAQRSGILELVFDDFAELKLQTIPRLEEAADEFEKLLDDDSSYFVHGIFKMHAPSDNIHRAVCLKQLVRCYMTLLKLSEGFPHKKEEIVRKGTEKVEKLTQVASASFDSITNRGLWARIGEFQFAIGNIKDAENAFERVCPRNLLEGPVERRFVSKHELTAAYGMADCYAKSSKLDQANILLHNLVDMLPETQQKDIENAKRHMTLLTSHASLQ